VFFGPFEVFRWGDGASGLTVFVLGAGLGLSSRWRVAALVLIPSVLVGGPGQWLWYVTANGAFTFDPGLGETVLATLPWIALAFLAASWRYVMPLRDRWHAAPAAV
jgi:hypothetical protein